MKSFNNFVNESIPAADVREKATKAAEHLQTEIQKILGDGFKVACRVSGSLGMSLNVDFHGKKFSNGIWQNSDTIVTTSAWLVSGSGKPIDLEKIELESSQFSRELKKAGVKFRKISDKTFDGLAAKYLKWLKANAEVIKRVEEEKE